MPCRRNVEDALPLQEAHLKRFPAIYPPLLAAYPILSLYAANQSLIPLDDLWRPLGFAVGGTILLWLLLGLILKDAQKGAIAATSITSGFLSLHLLSEIIPLPKDSIASVVSCGIIILSLTGLLAWKWTWHRPLSFFSMVILAFPIFQIASAQLVQSRASTTPELAKSDNITSRPDIVYIILDGYGRSDVLQKIYDYDNRDFIDSLEKRGFYVAKEAHTNYCQTELSISSSLNHAFIPEITSIKPNANPETRPNFHEALQNSAVSQSLKALGYQTSAITTGFPSLEFSNVDRKEITPIGVNLLESTLIQRLPFGSRSTAVASMFFKRHQLIKQAFAQLSTLSDQGPTPQFTIVHILAPHPPFSFGANGEELPRKGPFGYWDGSDFMTMVDTPEAYKVGYANQARYISNQILKSLDAILAKGGERPIIVIQGDHGPKMGLDQSVYERTDIHECFPILNAYLVPDNVQKELYASITPVNTFRTIFRTMFGDNLPDLPDRSWYSPYGAPLNFTEVTQRLATEESQIKKAG